jgi:hypothetical protein
MCHYRVHQSRTLVPTLSQINPFDASHSIYLRYNLLLFSRLCPILQRSFHSAFPTHTIHATCLANFIFTCLVTPVILGKNKSRSSSRFNFHHLPATCSLLGPNILLSALFSNFLSLCSFLTVRDHLPHPQKATGKVMLYIIIFNLRTAAFKAYCAIWVRCFNFRHQASPRVLPRESTQRRKVELWARNVREFCLNAGLHLHLEIFYMP